MYHANVLRMRARLQWAMHAGTPGGDALDVALRQMAKHLNESRQRRRPWTSAEAVDGTTACRPSIRVPQKLPLHEIVLD